MLYLVAAMKFGFFLLLLLAIYTLGGGLHGVIF